jgi:hypothetical protein
MNGPHEVDLTNPVRVALVAVHMVQEHDRTRLGWPRHDGKQWNPPALDFLSSDVRQEAKRVAAETLADWERCGEAFMGWNKIKHTYQGLVSSPAFRTQYVAPMADNKEQE